MGAAGALPLLPAGFPEPLTPQENPLTPEKVALGKLLFSDSRLSINNRLACASCHQPERYFTDGVPRPLGALGDKLPFNTPTLLNAAYSVGLSWVDKGFETLEQQHTGPLTNGLNAQGAPLEMGLGDAQLRALSADTALLAELRRAFPRAQGFTRDNIVKALASYVRTLVRGDSEFDRYLFNDDRDALSPQAQSGLALFTSPRLNCASCHRGFLLSGPTQSARMKFAPSFYRTGVSGSNQAFRVPSLRFVKHTGPYMHDGSIETLDAVIEFYASGADKGLVSGNPADKKLVAFDLSPSERRDLVAFLRSL